MTDTPFIATAYPGTELGSPVADSSVANVPLRVNRNRELAIREVPGTYYGMCEEGSLLVATNPTVSTGLTWVAAQTAYAATTPNFLITNTQPAGGKNVQLRYLKMIATAAGTAATVWHYAAILDVAPRALTTNNTVAITPVSPNGGLSVGSGLPAIAAQNNAIASVLAAESASGRVVARGALGGLNIVGDVFSILFGQATGLTGPLTAVEGETQSGARTAYSPPIIIAPGGCLSLHFWSPSSSAAFNPEFEMLLALK
jgi:hypothetical protein